MFWGLYFFQAIDAAGEPAPPGKGADKEGKNKTQKSKPSPASAPEHRQVRCPGSGWLLSAPAHLSFSYSPHTCYVRGYSHKQDPAPAFTYSRSGGEKDKAHSGHETCPADRRVRSWRAPDVVGGNMALSKKETCEGERPAMWRPGDVSPAEGMACAETLRWRVLAAQGAPGAVRGEGPLESVVAAPEGPWKVPSTLAAVRSIDCRANLGACLRGWGLLICSRKLKPRIRQPLLERNPSQKTRRSQKGVTEVTWLL